MKVVFPVTLKNAALYEQLSLLFEKMGPKRDHEVLIVSCPAAIEAAQKFGESIKRLFLNVEVRAVANVVENNNPSRNAMFRDAVYILEKQENRSPWIWMESAYPTDRDWLDMIQEEWNAMPRDKYFLGCVVKGYLPATSTQVAEIKLKNPEAKEPLFSAISPYMRFGVYRPDFYAVSSCVHTLSQTNRPFEIYIQDEVAPHCHPSDTIRTIWASKNFESNGHSYKGEQHPDFESEIRKHEPTGVTADGMAILHGCRDGSLGMVLCGKHWHQSAGRRPRPSGGGDEAAIKAALKEAHERIETLLKRVAELESENDYLRAESVTSEVVTTEAVPYVAEVQVAPVDVKVSPAPATAPKKRGRPRKVAVLA